MSEIEALILGAETDAPALREETRSDCGQMAYRLLRSLPAWIVLNASLSFSMGMVSVSLGNTGADAGPCLLLDLRLDRRGALRLTAFGRIWANRWCGTLDEAVWEDAILPAPVLTMALAFGAQLRRREALQRRLRAGRGA